VLPSEREYLIIKKRKNVPSGSEGTSEPSSLLNIYQIDQLLS
jgi:hypothetical protein